MKLLLVQHGEARSSDEDPDRSLTDAGIRTTRKMASWLAKQSVDIEEIRHSGKKRAAQTAEIFAGRLAPAKGSVAVPGLNPDDDVVSFAGQLDPSCGPLMLVGHLPFLGRLAGALVTGDPERSIVAFANSGIVCLEKAGESWSISWAVVPGLMAGS